MKRYLNSVRDGVPTSVVRLDRRLQGSVAALFVGLVMGASPSSAAADDASPAEASSPADSEAGWIDLQAVPALPSAVETELDRKLPVDAPRASVRPTARFGVRPVLGWQGAVPVDGPSMSGGRAGLRLVHQWWKPTTQPIRPAGETQLEVTGLFGDIRGFDATLDTTAGSWFGPVGVFAGGMARADRRTWTPSVTMAPAVGVGPTAHVALQVGPVTPWVGASPAWLVAGERPGLDTGPWDELTARGGVVFHRPISELRLSGSYRQVADAALWDVTLGIHLRARPSKAQPGD